MVMAIDQQSTGHDQPAHQAIPTDQSDCGITSTPGQDGDLTIDTGMDQQSSGHDQGATIPLAEAARQLGISVKTARRWIKAGRLPAVLADGAYGQEYRIPRTAITTTRQVVDVVKVERLNDPDALALAIVHALGQAQQPLLERIAGLEEEVRALRQDLAERIKLIEAPQEAKADDATLPQRAPWWRFWAR